MSHDCCVALPRGAIVCLQFVIVAFSDHTHLLFLGLILFLMFINELPDNIRSSVCLFA